MYKCGLMHTGVDRQMSAVGLARLVAQRRGEGVAYASIADAVRRAVLDGSLPLHTRLPSERDLARALTVSRTTTTAAYQRLREQGFIRTRRGSGSVTALPDGGSRRPGGNFVVATDEAPSDLVDLTIAAPAAPVQLHDAAVRALEVLPRHLEGTGYTFLGLPELRAAIAERFTRRGTPTTPDQVLVTSGAQQAVNLVVTTLLAAGERAVVENPTYPNAAAAIRATGARLVPVPVHADGHDLDLLESTVRQVAPRLVYVTPDHHNPTGTSLDGAGRGLLRDLAARHRTTVVADETMTDLALDGPPPEPVAGPDPPHGLVVVGSASKTFWGGLRVGWVRADHDVVTRLARRRAHHDISSPLLEQLVATELLGRYDEVVAERRRVLRSRRDTLLHALDQALPWRVHPPAGGLSVWADLGAPVSTALTALAARQGVRVVPGPTFGIDGAFEDRLRLTFAVPDAQIQAGVARLAQAWAALGLDEHGAPPVPRHDVRVV